jgi:DNA-binding YbaB/EbfC family protein
MLKQAQKMQEDMANLQADLEQREFKGSAGGGMVEVTVTGKHEIVSLKINPDAVDPDDVEMLEDFVTLAVNEAISNASKTQEEAFADFNTKLQAIIEAKVLDQYSDNKKAGEDFLAENAKKEGVTTTASGLQYKVLVEGKGALPTDSTVVKCKYEGRLIDGKVFDSTEKNGGEPFEVNMKFPRVIEGWVEALKLMPAGSKWEVYIPQELAYGSQDMGEIKPFSTLIFTIETLK